MTKVITVAQAKAQNVSVDSLRNCAEWNRECARKLENNPREGKAYERFSDQADLLDLVADKL